jgi:uncharacterized surface protein with fasciclin (FAS1) repeats
MIVFFYSCLPVSGPTNTTYPNLKALIKSGTNLTILDTALSLAGLDSSFTLGGPFTCFICTDQVYEASGISQQYVLGLPDSTLRKLILYSIINGSYPMSTLPIGPNKSATTVSGDSIFITTNGQGTFINGFPVIAGDVQAANGILDAMAQPLLPPTGTILQIAQADTVFSYFSAAVARTASAQTNINALLTGGGIYTVFLPTNSAFQAAGYTSIDSINNANPDTLSRILSFHIIPQRVFTSDFSTVYMANTIYPQGSVYFSIVGGTTYAVQGPADQSAVEILITNLMARNGVIHEINQLLEQ